MLFLRSRTLAECHSTAAEVETVLLGIQYKRKAFLRLDDSRIHGVEIKEALYTIQS